MTRPLGRVIGREHPPDRIGQGGDLFEAARDRLDPSRIERQPVDQAPRSGPWRGRPRNRAHWRPESRSRVRARFARAARSARFFFSAGALATSRAAARAFAPISRIAARTSVSGSNDLNDRHGLPNARSDPPDLVGRWRKDHSPNYGSPALDRDYARRRRADDVNVNVTRQVRTRCVRFTPWAGRPCRTGGSSPVARRR